MDGLFTEVFKKLGSLGSRLVSAGRVLIDDPSTSSLTGQLNNSLVTPTTLVSASVLNVMNDGDLKNVLDSILRLYQTLHLTTLQKAFSTRVTNISIDKVLDDYSTNSKGVKDILRHYDKDIMTSENFHLRKYTSLVPEDVGITVNHEDHDDFNLPSFTSEASKRDRSDSGANFNKSTSKMLIENPNLSIGYVSTLDIAGIDSSVTILYRLGVKNIQPELLMDLLEFSSLDKSFGGRWRSWKSEQITTTDFLFGVDIARKKINIKVSDSEGALEKVLNAKYKDTAYALSTGNLPLNRAMGIVVLTLEEVDQLQNHLGGYLNSYKVREKLFHGTALTLITVIDTLGKMVTIYMRDIEDYSVIPLKSFGKAESKSNDLTPVLETILQGNAPSTNSKFL